MRPPARILARAVKRRRPGWVGHSGPTVACRVRPDLGAALGELDAAPVAGVVSPDVMQWWPHGRFDLGHSTLGRLTAGTARVLLVRKSRSPRPHSRRTPTERAMTWLASSSVSSVLDSISRPTVSAAEREAVRAVVDAGLAEGGVHLLGERGLGVEHDRLGLVVDLLDGHLLRQGGAQGRRRASTRGARCRRTYSSLL